MSLVPEGEAIRKAVRFLSDERREHPEKSIGAIVNEASLRFDLSPLETEFLFRFATGDVQSPDIDE